MIKDLLNKFTLYRLTLYYLLGLLLFVLLFSLFGLMPFIFPDIFWGSIIVMAAGISTNFIFAKILHARSNIESVLITLLIVIFIFPMKFPTDILFAILGAVLAIASKYLLTVEKRHIFNPVAVAAVAVTMLYPDRGATWWIGIPIMVPFIVIGGVFIICKLKLWNVIIAFFATYFVATAFATFLHGGAWPMVLSSWQMNLTHSALLFFAFVMFTEPLTAPANRHKKIYFAILVALLYSTIQLRVLGISFTPEVALSLGNIYAYLVRPRKIG